MKTLKICSLVLLCCLVISVSFTQAQRSVDNAIEWAEGQVGSNDDIQCGRPWATFCMHFVGHAYSKVPSGFLTALTAWNSTNGIFDSRKEYNDPNAIPKGALVFFDTNQTPDYEHVGLYIGNGKVIHAWTDKVRKDDIDDISGKYLGWRWPNNWTDDSSDITEANCTLLESYYGNEFFQRGIENCIEALYYPGDNEYYLILSLVEGQSYCLATWINVDPSQSTPTVLGYSTEIEFGSPDDPGDEGTTYDGPDANIKEVELSNRGADSYHHTLTVDPGQKFDVRVEVTNKGDEDIDYFEVFVHRSPDKDFDEDNDYSYGREEEEDDLNDGKSTAKHRTCTAPTTPGTHYIFGYINRVDGEDGGSDQDWNNNYSRNDDLEEYGVLVVRDPNPPIVEDPNPPSPEDPNPPIVEEKKAISEGAIFFLLNL